MITIVRIRLVAINSTSIENRKTTPAGFLSPVNQPLETEKIPSGMIKPTTKIIILTAYPKKLMGLAVPNFFLKPFL